MVKSIEKFQTRDFSAYQAHYVALGAGDDTPTDKHINAYCETHGGAFPDKSFGAPNPLKFPGVSILNSLGSGRSVVPSQRSDCLSIATGRLLFSAYRSVSAQFPTSPGSGTLANYNVVGIVSPRGTTDIDPATQFNFSPRSFAHNYFLSGSFSAYGLSPK